MSDPENKSQGKGFKGLQSLGTKSPEPPAPAEHKPDPAALPPAWEEGIDQQTTQPQPTQSQTAAPSWRGWVIWLGMLVAIFVFFNWAGNQSSSNSSYSPSTATDHSSSAPVEPPPGPAITMPPVGNGRVLTSDQIRYCVYEDRRIKGAERAVNNYDQTSVSTFNAMVDDYNSRCSYFQYRQGALTPIQSEADQIQTQLEEEGRERMFNGDAAAADAAQAAANSAAAAAAAAAASVNATVPPNDSGSRNSGYDYSDAAGAASDAAAEASDAAAAESTEGAPGESAAEDNSASVDPENL